MRQTHTSFAVLIATENALRAFDRQRPHIHRLASHALDTLAALIREWAGPLRKLPRELIEEAARQWIGERDEIPTAVKFAAFARALQRSEQSAVSLAREVTEQERTVDRRSMLAQRAYQQLGDWRAVSEVQEELVRQAGGNPEHLAMIRDATVSLARHDQAIESVRQRHYLARATA